MSEAVPVSVAIAARNEAGALPALLSSLRGQAHPPAEVIIADGGSTDETVKVARACPGVRVLEIGPAFPGRGRNAALSSASHPWVALIDAGCVADRGWLAALVAALGPQAESPAVVCGHYAPSFRTEWDVAQALTTLTPVDTATGVRGPSTASMLIHREAWAVAGGFPEDLRAAEDLVFFERLRAAGVPFAWAPEAVVRWEMATGPRSFFRRLRLYSAHHSRAGLGRTWHRRVLLMDVAGLALLAAGAWLYVAWLVFVVGGLGRLFSTVWKRRKNVEGRNPFRPDRFARVAFLLVLADLATWVGLLDRLTGRVDRT